MNHNESNSSQFIALFNELDKYIEELLHIDVYLPYNDKLKLITEGNFPITHFVKRYYHELKYFGELRNHFTHGLRIDGKLFSAPTDYAIEELRKFKNAIKTPKTGYELWKKTIISCKPSDTIEQALHIMKQYHLNTLPVIADHQHAIGTITYQILTDYLMKNKLPGNVADLNFNTSTTLYIAQNMNLYQIEELFKISNKQGNLIEVLYITATGKPDEPLLSYILPQDIIKIQDHFFE